MVANMDNFIIEKSSGITTLILPKRLRHGHETELEEQINKVLIETRELNNFYILCDGEGGSLKASLAMALTIRSKAMVCTTIVDKLAVSGHSLLFAAGKKRIMLHATSQLGFHRAHYQESGEGIPSLFINMHIAAATKNYRESLERYFGGPLPHTWFDQDEFTYVNQREAYQKGWWTF